MQHPYIWATLEDFVPPRRDEKIVGRQVANSRFLRALLRHSRFDEFHFFLLSKKDAESFLDVYGEILRDTGAQDRVRVFCRTELPMQIQSVDYVIFHLGDHLRYFNSLCHLRNASGRFPVSAFIHSLNYPRDFSAYQEMVLGGVSPGDCIICSSSAGRETILRYLSQAARRLHKTPPSIRLEVIPYGIDGQVFRGVSKREARERLGIGHGERIGIYVGRFSDYDKMDLFPLIQAFHMVYTPGQPWRLVLAGSGHSMQYVEMLRLWARALNVSGQVRFVVDPSEDEKVTWLKAADFFISPTDNFQETFGIALLEAMASGLPLVVSDFDGYRDLVREGVGFRIRTTWADVDLPTPMAALMHDSTVFRYQSQSVCVDLDQLAQVMHRLYVNSDLCESMGQTARKRFEEEFEERVFISRLESLWMNLKRSFSTDGVSRGVSEPSYPHYFENFSHYVTELLDERRVVCVSDFARLMASCGLHYPLLADMEQFVKRTLIQEICDLATEPKSVAEIISCISCDRKTALYHLLWMLKHGLLTEAKPTQCPHTIQ